MLVCSFAAFAAQPDHPHMPTYTPTFLLALESHTALAEQLNAAMAADHVARIRYLAVYGYAWSPLPLNGNPTAPELTAGRLSRSAEGTAR